MTRIYLSALLLVCICGCTHNRNKEIPPVEAQIININDAVVNYQDAGLDIAYAIKLQTSDNVLINQIAKVILHKENLYILTAQPQNNVYIFSSKGVFIRKLTKGRANNEVSYPTDISVDTKNDKLIILDNYRNTKEFLLDGEYITQTSFPESQFYVESIGDNNAMLFYCPNMSSKNQFVCYYKTAEKLRGIYKSTYAGQGFQNFGMLTKINQDSVLICPLFSDTVYLFNPQNQRIDPYFIVNYDGKSANTPSRIETFNNLHDYTQAIESNHWFSGPKAVFLSKDKFFFNYGINNQWGIFDRRENKLVVYKRMFDELPNYFGKVGQDGNNIIYAYDTPWLKSHFQKHPPMSEIGNEIAVMCNNEEDNPILIFAKIK